VSHSFGFIPRSGIPRSYGRSMFSFFFLENSFFFFYSYVHTMFGSFLPPSPCPFPYPHPLLPLLLPLTPPYPSLPGRNYFALISNFVEESISNNRKDQGFLLIEIRIAIQGVDLHCFPVHVCYLLN
jgi:hypothetical protein